MHFFEFTFYIFSIKNGNSYELNSLHKAESLVAFAFESFLV